MAFKVILRQYPYGMDSIVTKVEASQDRLHLLLAKDPDAIISINKGRFSAEQKKAISYIGGRLEITAIEPDNGDMLVTAKQSGFYRTWRIDRNGKATYADGQGHSVNISRADPLVS